MARQVALLRGINLARNRRVAMSDLRHALAERYADVTTHGQSGNVVLSAASRGAALQRELERLLESALGLKTQVVVRSQRELAAVVERNPLEDVATNPSRHLVTFLAGTPDPARVKALDPDAFVPERFVVAGREVYSWHPDGLQRSKLAKAAADGLGVVGTARNWNTVTKLLALVSG